MNGWVIDPTILLFIDIGINYYMRIYKITNKLNNKVYVGQTNRSIEERWHGPSILNTV
jgi:hypothetical protein